MSDTVWGFLAAALLLLFFGSILWSEYATDNRIEHAISSGVDPLVAACTYR